MLYQNVIYRGKTKCIIGIKPMFFALLCKSEYSPMKCILIKDYFSFKKKKSPSSIKTLFF